MAEINVNVSAGKQQKITVSSAQNSTEITASADTGRFWAQTSKNWAVSENIVDNEDYSSKYYANKSKGYAQNAENFEGAARETYNNLIVKSENAITDIETAKADAVGNITTARDESIASVEAKSDEILSAVNQGIADINSTKTTILNDIEFVADGEKEEIKELVDTGKNEIQELADEIKENASDIINRVSLSMFDTILKDHLLTYEESKGLALQGTYVYKDAIAGSRYGYPDFYAKCLEEYNEATATETVNGVTVKVHSNGHKFYDIANKSAIDGFFNTMGSAWFYGVDTAEERIFLPRNNFFEQMTANVAEVGDSVQAGLPNITGSASSLWCIGDNTATSGAISKTSVNKPSSGSMSSGGANRYIDLALDASHSSAIYGRSTTVQPNAVKKLLYICVGNTVADTSWVDVVTQVEGGVKDLEDKTLEGIERLKQSSTALTQTQITNCLLEVPQRIKLELNAEKSLVLKIGSEYIVPNGFEDDGVTPKFNHVTTDIDIQQGNGHAAQDLYFVRNYSSPKYLIGFQATRCFSGNTAPTGFGTYAFWYDTANNLVKWTQDSGTTWTSGYSFPVGLTTGSSATVIASIDQVFNGMGCIGNTEWLDKGVKGLVPNGRNEDGTLNNIEITTDKVYTYSVSALADNMVTYFDLTRNIFNCGYNFVISETQPADSVIYSMWYQPSTNLIRWHSTAGTGWEVHNVLMLGSQDRGTNGVITSSNPKQPFRAVDYSDYVNTPHIVEVYQNGTSWYRVWSDGWCEQGGYSRATTTGTTLATVTLLKPYRDVSYTIVATKGMADGASVALNCPVNQYVNSFTWSVAYNSALDRSIMWQASGYIA